MPDIVGELGTGSVGTPTPDRAVPLSGWFGYGRFVALAGMLASCSAGTVAPYQTTGNTIWAASPAWADVRAAVLAASPGDTVRIPAGTASWSSGQRLPTITFALSIIGAGIDQTIINSAFAYPSENLVATNALIAFEPSDASVLTDPVFRLSGMTINFSSYNADAIMLLSGGTNAINYPCTNIRIDHMKITGPKYLISRYGTVYGVCDNCILNGNFMSNTSLNDLWVYKAYDFGDKYNFYFEDNAWTGENMPTLVSDGNHSPRYAFRHNTINISNITYGFVSPLFDLHGNQPTPMRAGQGAEVYENNFILGNKTAKIMDQRGGKMLVYNNTVIGNLGQLPRFCPREVWDDGEQPTGTNERGIAGENQISGQPQHVSDSYYWGNTYNGSKVDALDDQEHFGYPDGVCPTENVHFWNQQTVFNGTVGMGRGLLSARPESGLTVGVGYFATDTNILYRATGPSNWEEFYTAYTYPHPLRSEAFVGNSYYVDTDNLAASDSNPGTEALPWKTITKANAALVAGDTAYIKAGTYSGQYISPAAGGTYSRRITYRIYGSDIVTVSASTQAITLSGKSFVTVWGVAFYNCDRFLKISSASHYNIIASCKFDQQRTRSDWSGSSITGGSKYNWIHDCQFSNYGEVIDGDDRGCVLDLGTEETSTDYSRYNVIENCALFHGSHHVFGCYSRYNTIRNNYIHNDGWIVGTGAYGSSPYGGRALSFGGYEAANGYNLFENNRVGFSGNSPDQDGVTQVLLVQKNCIVRFNEMYHGLRSGLAMGLTSSYLSDITYNKIYNNTFFNSGLHAGSAPDDSSIFLVIYSGTHVIENNAIKNNIMYKNAAYIGEYGAAHIADQILSSNWDGDTNGDPLFVNASVIPGDPSDPALPNLTLQEGSPCRNAGAHLTQASGAGTLSTALIVDDAGYFQDGSWGPAYAAIEADWIAVGTVGNVSQIERINYFTNTITLATQLSWADNANVWLYKKSDGAVVLSGAAPNIGAN